MGRPAYIVKQVQTGGIEAKEIATRLSKEIGFATAKVPAEDLVQANSLVDVGFRVVDCALTFSKSAEGAQECASTREAIPGDESRVREIAGSAFRCSRFHLDPFISNTLANIIKADWAGNFFKGLRGNAMLIAEVDGMVAGFCQLIIRDSKAVIDLIAVAPSFSRRGLARNLIASITACAARKSLPVQSLVVGTQAANTPSVNLYESLGFRLVSSTLVLHHTAP